MQAPVLYHSFPRRKGQSSDERSLAVLKSILEHGLLITPEIVPWTTSDGTPFKVAQKRICFTAIDHDHLSAHSRMFGDVSIGFRRQELEEVGAVPVFYVPRSASGKNRKGNIGGFHMERVYQLLTIVQDLRRDPRPIVFRGKEINLDDMEWFVRNLSTQFYPVEDVEDDKDRHYFAQREWRIQGNLLFEGVPLSRKLSESESEKIAAIDPEYFGRELEFPTGSYPLIRQTMLLPQVGGRPVREAIASVVAPSRLESAVRGLLNEVGVSPNFQPLP